MSDRNMWAKVRAVLPTDVHPDVLEVIAGALAARPAATAELDDQVEAAWREAYEYVDQRFAGTEWALATRAGAVALCWLEGRARLVEGGHPAFRCGASQAAIREAADLQLGPRGIRWTEVDGTLALEVDNEEWSGQHTNLVPLTLLLGDNPAALRQACALAVQDLANPLFFQGEGWSALGPAVARTIELAIAER
jgi:hypothetical protein